MKNNSHFFTKNLSIPNICIIFVSTKGDNPTKRIKRITMKTTDTQIGLYKASVYVYCEICGKEHKRTSTAPAYTGEAEEKEEALKTIKRKLSKPYTCRICKVIAG